MILLMHELCGKDATDTVYIFCPNLLPRRLV